MSGHHRTQTLIFLFSYNCMMCIIPYFFIKKVLWCKNHKQINDSFTLSLNWIWKRNLNGNQGKSGSLGSSATPALCLISEAGFHGNGVVCICVCSENSRSGILTKPSSGTAAWTFWLTACARLGQCWGGRNPFFGSVRLPDFIWDKPGPGTGPGTRPVVPLLSYTFICSLLPCRAALCGEQKHTVNYLDSYWFNKP